MEDAAAAMCFGTRCLCGKFARIATYKFVDLRDNWPLVDFFVAL